jgi:hypothetical protein
MVRMNGRRRRSADGDALEPSYPAYAPRRPVGSRRSQTVCSAAGWGVDGVSITDSLDGAAHARGITPVPLALRAAGAGVDIMLITGSEATSQGVLSTLRAAARDGTLDRAALETSYRRILRLKQGIGR